MKIFNTEDGSWSSKVNFVDENNVMLGYDTNQWCCENAGWCIGDESRPTAQEIEKQNHTLENESDWVFDANFFQQTSNVVVDKESYNPLDEGAVATFRLVDGNGRQKFLHLFNCHNGYYSHGFEFKKGDTILRDGGI